MPPLHIHLMMDNEPSHTSAAIGPGRPPPVCHHLQAQARLWLSIVGQWPGVLTRRLLRHGDFASSNDLEDKITAFTSRHNKHARPYKWSVTPTAALPQTHRQPEPVPALAEVA
jgi:hypothetical protein